MWKYTGVKESNEFLLSLHLLNCKDNKRYIRTLYSISNNVQANYRVYKIKKKNGSSRTIREPNPLLKHIQRRILNGILAGRSISNYAKAYKKGISLIENASPHVGKKIILKLDIKNFFENITFLKIYVCCFPIEYFPKSVGMLLTTLCTYDDHLSQGSPTSPYISNLVMKEFDEEIGKWCKNNHIDYTRYSDDMTFSGDFEPTVIIKKAKKLLSGLGLELNKQKIHIVRQSAAQNITGIVVNEKPQTAAFYRKKIRQALYYIDTYGLVSHMKKTGIEGEPRAYLNTLYRKISFVLQINPIDKEFLKYKKQIATLLAELS